MLCCESGIMRKDSDNPLALSSKKPCQGHQKGYGRELERLRADWEAEKKRTQRARGHLSVELRHLREKAEREQQRAVREQAARRGCQKEDRHSDRYRRLLAKEVNIKDSELDSTQKETFCLCTGETYTKLEQLLLTLYEKIDGEQTVYKLHHRQELELEKAVFLCHLLEAHGRLLQGRAGHTSHTFKSLQRKPAQEDASSNSRQIKPGLIHCRALLQSASRSPKRKTKQVWSEQPLGRAVSAADPCTAAAVVDTCRSGSLKICHPHNAPHAGWDDQPPSCTESSGSEKSSPSKCMDRNMEVSYFIFPDSTHGS